MSTISKLILENCQIKSAEKFKAVCSAMDVLEIETFVRSGQFVFRNVFICPDIDLMPFYESDKPTERLIAGLAMRLHVAKYGKYSDHRYLAIVKPKKSILNNK